MKSLTVGQKIAGGFTALILLAVLLGGMAAFTMRSVQNAALQMSTEFVPEAKLGSAINDAVARTQLAARTYGLTADEKYAVELQKGIGEIEREVAAAQVLSDGHPQLIKLREHLMEFNVVLKEYKTAVGETEAKNRLVAAVRERLNTTAVEFVAAIDKIIASQNERLDKEVTASAGTDPVLERHRKLTLVHEIRGEGNAARIAVFKAQALRTPQIIADAMGSFEAMATRFTVLKGLLKVPADIEEMERTQKAAQAYQHEMKEIMVNLIALDEVAQKRAAAGRRLDDLATETSLAGMQRTVTSAETSSTQLTRALTTTFTVLGIVIALGTAVAIVIVRGVSRVLHSTTDALTAGAEQIAAAANQVSGSSQSLAEGASEQAASLEETSASIEEMSGMTKRNAQSANQAKALAQSARSAADSSANSVAKLNTAMTELKASSSQISKIVKTIDEIAFQTNILALNAAVEAARAGESGMGFAVVAEEVRSLAQRSAQAAKETAEKIESALARSEDGARISLEVSGDLTGIIDQVRKLDGVVSEIAEASAQQAQGIEQVNTAVSQMDKVTQSNAAAAEESASAAEEMNAQTAELNNLVGDLLMLVDGRRSKDHLGLPGEALPGGRRDRESTMVAKPEKPRAVASASSEAAPATAETLSFN